LEKLEELLDLELDDFEELEDELEELPPLDRISKGISRVRATKSTERKDLFTSTSFQNIQI